MESSSGSGGARPTGANGDAADWQTADRATDALISAAARVSSNTPKRKPSSERSRGPLVAAAALLVGGLGVWFVTRDGDSANQSIVAGPVTTPEVQPTEVQQTIAETEASSTPAPTATPVETSVPVAPSTPTTLVPVALAGSPLVPFTFTLKADGKAYARGTLPDEAAAVSVLASGEAVVGAGNVVLENVTTDPAAVFELSQKNLLTTSFYYTQGNGDISLDHQLRLDVVATMMVANPSLTAYISGFSDSTGGTAGNLRLSQIRVDKLSAYLVGKGVAASQFRLAVIGEEQAVGDNTTESGRALNRRVDIQFDGQNLGL